MSDSGILQAGAEVVVDDCWNRIGVRGDHSCVKLKEYFRCLNCPTFAAGASVLLDRPVSEDHRGDIASVQFSSQAGGDDVRLMRGRGDAIGSMLVFRVGAEWLGLPTTSIVEVIEARTIHSLPHQANPAVLGLTNIRGALKICVSLGGMLGIDDAGRGKSLQRLLVVQHEEQILVFPVDEVAGVHGYAADAMQTPPATMAQAGRTYTRSVIAWRDKKVGLLDGGLLFYALNRSLT